MKRIAIAAAAALVMLGTSAQAQQRSPLYGEIGYSFLEFDFDDGSSVHPQALRGIIGYEFHPNIAVEGMVMFGTKGDSDEFGDIKLRNAFGIYAKPKMDFGNIEAFGRLGWARTKVRFSDAFGSESESDTDFSYGLGVNYRFNPKMSAGIDWMRYFSKDGGKIQGWTVNFGYRF